MPLNYSITIDIKGEFNYENVKKILLRGQELEIFYYRERKSISDKSIDLEMAINKILNKDKLNDFHNIGLKIDEETYTDFHYNQHRENQLSIWFSSMFKPKEEDLENSLAQYTRVLLYMSQDFPYISIDVEHNDYPQETFNEIENKFYLRASTKSEKLFAKNFINNAIANNIIFYEDNKQITSINQLEKRLACSFQKTKNPFVLKFKVEEEQGTITLSRYSSNFNEIMETTDFFKNQKDNWTVDIDITFTDLKQCWIKKFPDGTQALDLAKYANLILNLNQGSGIIELKIGKYLQ